MGRKTKLQTILDTIYVSVLAKIKDISKRNVAFHALSAELKRKEIALDSLQLLLTGTITGAESSYWGDKLNKIAHTINARRARVEAPDKEFQEQLCKLPKGEACAVCARGAVMLSTIRLGNNIDPDETYKAEGNTRIVQGFSMYSMLKMESEYERGSYSHPYYDNTDAKLGNILMNVLHNGDFSADDRIDYLSKYGIVLDNYDKHTNE